MSHQAITVRAAAWAVCLLLPGLASAQALSPPPMEAEVPTASASATQAAVMATTTLEVLSDVMVTQIGTYQDVPTHFIWFTKRGAQCALEAPPVHHFADDQGSGAALHATLMTALVNQRKLDVRVNGCRIYEVYLR
ncbi:hypothetical protein [Pseudoxanthomonas wuyuanensis]